MTTQYTPILQLALPVTGELNGTWGDVVNDNITSMVEEAIAGLATISTWPANSHTLTTSDGVTDEARCAMLVATGTAAASNLICPDRTKLYVLKNASSYAVTLKTSAGTGVAVAAGDTAFLFCDGTNVGSCVTQIVNGHITGNLTVDGNTTLGDASGDTVTVNAGTTTFVNANPTLSQGTSTRILFLNGSKVIADAAGLTWDGTTMSATRVATSQVNITGQGDLRLEDTTGGEYVALQAPGTLSASYTLTMPADDGANGQALITDGSGNLSWSTAASGDVYGPASATDNAVARFDLTTGKIIQNSGVIIDDSNNVTGVAALTASGNVTLSGGTANGVAYLNGSKVLTTGSALTFDGTNLATTGGFYLKTAGTKIGWDVSGVYFNWIESGGTTGADYLRFGIANVERMRLTSTGLGIGTSSVTSGYKLEVAGNIYANSGFFSSKNGGNQVYFGAAGQMNFGSTGSDLIIGSTASAIRFGSTSTNTEWMRLDSSGNLGLGVTPSAWYASSKVIQIGAVASIEGISGANITYANAYRNTSNSPIYITSDYATKYVQNAGQHQWHTAPSGTAGAAITFTQAMTLDASGNLGIGQTNPSAWLVNGIGIGSGSLDWGATIYTGTSSTGYLCFADGTSTTDRYRGYVSYSHATDALILATSATERMRIDSSGNVGIGTSSPATKLTISGNNDLGTENNTLRFVDTDIATQAGQTIGKIEFYTSDLSGSGPRVTGYMAGIAEDQYSATYLSFATAIFNGSATERMRIDSVGNLGLGVTPSAWSLGKALQVNGSAVFNDGSSSTYWMNNAYYNGGFKYFGSSGASSYAMRADGSHQWYTAPSGTAGNTVSFTQAMTLDASGNLAIGDTSAYGYRLLVNGGDLLVGRADTTAAKLVMNNSSGNSGIASSGNNLIFYNASANTERMRIDSSGNLLVGTNSLVSGDGVSFSPYAGGFYGVTNHKTGAASGDAYHFFKYNGTSIGSITQSGTTAVLYNTSSDYRLKENIQPMQNALAIVAQLNPVTYNWKADGSDGQGFIAHELQAVVPDCVTGEKDAVDAEGKPVYQGIDTSFLVATLTKAIQEQQELINALTARVAQLEGN